LKHTKQDFKKVLKRAAVMACALFFITFLLPFIIGGGFLVLGVSCFLFHLIASCYNNLRISGWFKRPIDFKYPWFILYTAAIFFGWLLGHVFLDLHYLGTIFLIIAYLVYVILLLQMRSENLRYEGN